MMAQSGPAVGTQVPPNAGPYTTAATIRTRPAKLTIWRPFLILVSREIRHLRREAVRFAIRIATISLATVFVFDFILPQIRTNGSVGVAVGYATVLAPGMVAVTTCNQALSATLTALSRDFGPLRRIDQILMAPLPVPFIGLARIIGGTLHGILAACVVLPIVAFVHAPGAPPILDLARWPFLMAIVATAGFLFAGLGLIIGTAVNPAKASSLLPYGLPVMIMLGCVYYPWSSLGVIPWLQYGVLLNPVVYITEATRFAIAPQLPHLPQVVLFWVIGVGAMLSTAIGLACFTARTRR